MVTRPSRERVIPLGWAAPYLVFLIMPFIDLIKHWDSSPRSYAIGMLLIAFALTYLSAWLVVDLVPRGHDLNRNLIIVAGVLLAIQTILWWITGPTMIYLIAYLIPLVLLIPRRLIIGFIGVVVAVATAQALITPSNQGLIPFVIIALNIIIMGVVRSSIVSDRRDKVALAQQHALSQEQQRLQLASDLHDVLGQQLTAISVKAELLNRLVAADQPKSDQLHAARQEADDVATLARQALTDVRTVVAQTRQARLADEFDNAFALLTAAGLHCHVDAQIDLDELEPSSLVGRFAPYVIREGCTNVVHHAVDSTSVTIRIDGQTVEITEDGRAGSDSGRAGGTGLTGLHDRVGNHGQLLWGPQPDATGWRLALVPAPEPVTKPATDQIDARS